MNTPFLITGLPRSRTAWLSVFFNYGPSHCRHEAMGEFRSADRLLWELSKSSTISGDSDSALCLYADEVIAAVEDSRCSLVVVHRGENGCRAALRNSFEGLEFDADKTIDGCLPGYEKFRSCVRAHHVSFNDLSDTMTMRNLYAFVLPGHPFPFTWNQMLQGLRITQLHDVAMNTLTN